MSEVCIITLYRKIPKSWRCYELSQNEKVRNAEDILPKPLLRKLQHYCSGLVYIPQRKTQAQSNRDRVRVFHSQGVSPIEIAQRTTLSIKHVRRIIRQLSDGVMPESTIQPRIYKFVPEDIVEMIQRYVEGPVYVPLSTSPIVRRHAHVKRLLREGHTTAEVASRTKMSERRIWQLKVEYAEEIAHPKQTAKQQATPGSSITSLPNVTIVESTETAEAPPRVCRLCGNVLEPHEGSCIMCSRRPPKEKGDPDIIVVSTFPFAIIERNF